MTRVFLVEDDAAVRDSLRLLLDIAGYTPELFGSGEEFLDSVARPMVGCLITDVRLPGMSGLDLHAEIKQRGIALPVIFITGHADLPMAIAALRQGALDFLEKPIDDDALLASVRAALAPRESVAELRTSLEAQARLARLTPREREVLELVVAGCSSRAIGDRLGISVRTVENHRAHVMEKMQAASTAQLIRIALGALGSR